MNVEQLDKHIYKMGGTIGVLEQHLDPRSIEDPGLRSAWGHLLREWLKFERELDSWAVIFGSKVYGHSSV